MSLHVELLWLYASDGGTCSRKRIYSDGRAEMIINLASEPLRLHHDEAETPTELTGALVCGPRSDAYALDVSRGFSLMGVLFRPFGTVPFLKAPARDAFGAHVAGDALWGDRSAALGEQLAEAKDDRTRFRVLEATLETWLADSGVAEPPDPAVPYALRRLHQGRRARSVQRIRDELGLSHRRFVNLFRDHVGMAPKLYGRIQRFQLALRTISGSDDVDWPGVAHDCGYYDQSHFIRDFRAFSGTTPSQYLTLRRRHLDHIPPNAHEFFTTCDCVTRGTVLRRAATREPRSQRKSAAG